MDAMTHAPGLDYVGTVPAFSYINGVDLWGEIALTVNYEDRWFRLTIIVSILRPHATVRHSTI